MFGKQYFTRIAIASLVCLAMGKPAGANLIEYLPLHGNATAVVGTSGTLNGTQAPNIGGPVPIADRFGAPGGALGFDGVDDYVSVAGGGGLNNLQTGTIDLFVRWSGLQDRSASGFGSILARQANGQFSNDVLELDAVDPSAGHIVWSPYGAGGVALRSTTAVGDGAWHNIAITFTSGSQQLSIDGVLDATSSLTGIIANSASVPLTIGAWIGDGNGFSRSSISDFRVYDTILGQGEIQALAGTVPEPPSLTMAVISLVGVGLIARLRGA